MPAKSKTTKKTQPETRITDQPESDRLFDTYFGTYPDQDTPRPPVTFADTVNRMLTIHKAKNNDYSPQGAFGNFSESEKIGIPAWKGAFVRLQDKYTRATNIIGGKEIKVLDEKLEDTLLDLANYAVIVMVLLDRDQRNIKI